MIRTAAFSRALTNTRYLVNHKKPIVEMPSTKPPKYIYKIEYLKYAVPTFEDGLPDHKHSNPFEEAGMNEFQLYQLKYTGQHWYVSNPIGVFLTFAFIAMLIYMIQRDEAQNRKYGRQGMSICERIPDIMNASKNGKLNL